MINSLDAKNKSFASKSLKFWMQKININTLLKLVSSS